MRTKAVRTTKAARTKATLAGVLVAATALAGCGSAHRTAATHPAAGPPTSVALAPATTTTTVPAPTTSTAAPTTTAPPTTEAPTTAAAPAPCPPAPASVYGVDPDTMASTGTGTQLLTVVDATARSEAGLLTAWTRSGSCWVPVQLAGQPAAPFRAETGDGGIKPVAERVSGDESTPSGLFGFQTTLYGVSSVDPSGSFAYRQLTCGDWWDEQPGSPTYDSFEVVPCGVEPPYGPDSESLWTETVAYQHFADIATPAVPQNSAGIFLHDDTTSGYTAGCVALPPSELDAVLAWMQPADRPVIAIGVAGAMGSL